MLVTEWVGRRRNGKTKMMLYRNPGRNFIMFNCNGNDGNFVHFVCIVSFRRGIELISQRVSAQANAPLSQAKPNETASVINVISHLVIHLKVAFIRHDTRVDSINWKKLPRETRRPFNRASYQPNPRMVSKHKNNHHHGHITHIMCKTARAIVGLLLFVRKLK